MCSMSQTLPDAPTNEPRSSTDEPRARRRGVLPWWLWVSLALVIVAVLIIVALPLLSGGGSSVTPSSNPTVPASASPSPTSSASSPPTPTPTPTGTDLGQGTFTSEMFGYMSDVLNSQNTSVLAQSPNFSNPVLVVAANSGLNQNMSPDDAVSAMGSMFTPLDPNPWDLALPNTVLETYRSGPYGQYFPQGAIVAKSHDGHVFSFIGNGSTITTMFMAASEGQLQ